MIGWGEEVEKGEERKERKEREKEEQRVISVHALYSSFLCYALHCVVVSYSHLSHARMFGLFCHRKFNGETFDVTYIAVTSTFNNNNTNGIVCTVLNAREIMLITWVMLAGYI